LSCGCPLWVKSRHRGVSDQCPLLAQSGHHAAEFNVCFWRAGSTDRRNTLRDGVDGRWVEDMVRGFNTVAKEELWNRWRCAFAVQPSGSATQRTVARDFGPRNPSRTRFDSCVASTGRHCDAISQCPLWVKSRHDNQLAQCPLYLQKQTLELSRVMSALCQKQTFCAAVQNPAIRSPRRRAQAASAVL
jgi:hypothetical protein